MHFKFPRILNCFVAIFVLLICADVMAESDAGITPQQQRDYVEGEVLVKFRASATAVDRIRVRSSVLSVRQVSQRISKLQVDLSVDEALEQLRNDPGVEYVQPNYLKRLQAVPNDENFQYQWGLKNIGQRVPLSSGTEGVAAADISAEQAWDVTTGDSGVVIAILDTGIDSGHPELSNVVWTNVVEAAEGQNGVDDDGNGYVDDINGWDMANDDSRPLDINGHGTQIAGIIAARANDNVGVAGVMWSASILPLQVFDANGVATTENIVKAIDYAIAQGADIINASFGAHRFDQAEYDAINRANDAGILFVAAACNQTQDNDDLNLGPACMPASYTLPNIISVAASDHFDQLSSFSNWGLSSVDFTAPGENIISTELAYAPVLVLGSVSGHMQVDLPQSLNAVDLTDRKACRLVINSNVPFPPSVDSLSIVVSLDGSTFENSVALNSFPFYFDLSDFDGHRDLNIEVTVPGSLTVGLIAVGCYSGNYDFSSLVYSSGTSLSSAYVAGVAGLVLAKQNGLSPQQMVEHLLESVDEVTAPPGLFGLVKSGGRINANKAVSGVLPVPTTQADEVPDGDAGGGGGVMSSVLIVNLLIMLIFLHYRRLCARRVR